MNSKRCILYNNLSPLSTSTELSKASVFVVFDFLQQYGKPLRALLRYLKNLDHSIKFTNWSLHHVWSWSKSGVNTLQTWPSPSSQSRAILLRIAEVPMPPLSLLPLLVGLYIATSPAFRVGWHATLIRVKLCFFLTIVDSF